MKDKLEEKLCGTLEDEEMPRVEAPQYGRSSSKKMGKTEWPPPDETQGKDLEEGTEESLTQPELEVHDSRREKEADESEFDEAFIEERISEGSSENLTGKSQRIKNNPAVLFKKTVRHQTKEEGDVLCDKHSEMRFRASNADHCVVYAEENWCSLQDASQFLQGDYATLDAERGARFQSKKDDRSSQKKEESERSRIRDENVDVHGSDDG